MRTIRPLMTMTLSLLSVLALPLALSLGSLTLISCGGGGGGGGGTSSAVGNDAKSKIAQGLAPSSTMDGSSCTTSVIDGKVWTISFTDGVAHITMGGVPYTGNYVYTYDNAHHGTVHITSLASASKSYAGIIIGINFDAPNYADGDIQWADVRDGSGNLIPAESDKAQAGISFTFTP